MDNKRKSERIRMDGSIEIIVIEELGKDEKIDDRTYRHDLIDSNNEKIIEIIDGYLINISAGAILTEKDIKKYGSGGMLLKTYKEIEKGRELILTFEMPFDKIREDFAIRGKVLRSTKKDDYYELAVQFKKMLMHYTDNEEFDDLNYLLNI